MISHRELEEMLNQDVIKMLGFSNEYFFSLPIECQNEIMIRFFENSIQEKGKSDLKKQRDNIQKKMALKQYIFEENVKEKILTLFKKNK